MYDLTPPHLRTVVFRQGWKAEVVTQLGGGFRVLEHGRGHNSRNSQEAPTLNKMNPERRGNCQTTHNKEVF